jgi:hypothetical protein
MSIPEAPKEGAGAGDKILFLTGDSAGSLNGSHLLRAYNPTGSEASDSFGGTADMGVVSRKGSLIFKAILLASSDLQRLSDMDGMVDAECSGVKLQAPSTNTDPIYVGDAYQGGTPTTAWAMAPGSLPLDVPCRRLSEVYIQGTSGDVVVVLSDALWPS